MIEGNTSNGKQGAPDHHGELGTRVGGAGDPPAPLDGSPSGTGLTLACNKATSRRERDACPFRRAGRPTAQASRLCHPPHFSCLSATPYVAAEMSGDHQLVM